MESDFLIFLTPVSEGEAPEPIPLQQVSLGFNQMGWLVVQDKRRDIVASFAPGSVRFALKTDDNEQVSEDEAHLLIFNKDKEPEAIN